MGGGCGSEAVLLLARRPNLFSTPRTFLGGVGVGREETQNHLYHSLQLYVITWLCRAMENNDNTVCMYVQVV